VQVGAHDLAVVADRTVFAAESIGPRGQVVSTQILRIREGRLPEFLLFDSEGRLSDRFIQRDNQPQFGSQPIVRNVPRSCLGCHVSQGESFHEPMMGFPVEKGLRRVLVDERYRDLEIVGMFLEGYYRAGRQVYGPYASIWLTKLREDAKAGTLTAEDRGAYDALREFYPDVLGEE